MQALSTFGTEKSLTCSTGRKVPLNSKSRSLKNTRVLYKRIQEEVPKPTASSEVEERSEFVSGEWPVNWSLASMEDCAVFYQNKMHDDHVVPHYSLKDVMTQDLITTTPDATVDSIKSTLNQVHGVPVVMSPGSKLLLGMVTKQDLDKKGKIVKQIMSTPPIALLETSDISAAACTMLKYKIHRVPIVNMQKEVVGIVSRTDVFQALEIQNTNPDFNDN
eukprot:TRINITY_DN38130_c0_g1_i12.p1 TRINITY_DN38130_c0_g1~~TRINITY_DN38130_c0_g1_i12.p1  ORF type:complete len:219 (-),score=28.61 TRINITY_DN38130_c0_g1_i12:410-1066(-)